MAYTLDIQSNYVNTHVSHFTWSSTVTAAVGKNNSGDNLFCDENHKISVDGSPIMYYALSKEEWSYLFNTRTMKNVDHRYSLNITYCGINGVVLYPDDYDGGILSGTVTALPDGAIFLPITGRRNISDLYDMDKGYYISSSTASGNDIYRMVFTSSSVQFNTVSRYAGSAVRLVTNY